MNSTLLKITLSLSAILGLVYIFPVYGVRENEVIIWGLVSFIFATLVFVLLARGKTSPTLIKWTFILLFLWQVLPIYYWFTMPSLSDSLSNFHITFWYSVPHGVIVLCSLFGIFKLIRKKLVS